MDIIFLCENKDTLPRVFAADLLEGKPMVTRQELLEGKTDTSGVRFVFSTWGMPSLTEEEIAACLPSLEAVFYGAGSVQGFARPFLNLGIKVFSAWAANAVPVAEFTAAQIVLANKGYFQLHNRYRKGHREAVAYADGFCGNYDTQVGLLGAGMIGRKVLELLAPYKLRIMVFDPFLNEEQIRALGAEKASLEQIFSSCQTISNHLANNAQTVGILNYSLFSLMKENSTFINTGRGMQVAADDLYQAMKQHPNRTALLDVTDPEEPLSPASPFWQLDNVFFSPHRAGSAGNETLRMGSCMFEEYTRYLNGEPVRYEVTLKMLETMA